MTASDLKVFDSLSVVTIRGYQPQEIDGNTAVDKPGEANFIVSLYGVNLNEGEFDPQCNGIIWTDYDSSGDDPWSFRVLIAADEVAALVELCGEHGYTVLGTPVVDEPMRFGDGGGVVTIMKHPDGWVLAN